MARLGLADLAAPALDVVVGGLGLGYTAGAVLENTVMRHLLVIEALSAVIEWHQREWVPLGSTISRDPRCRNAQNNFFERALSDDGFDSDTPGRRFHAILLDIDHSPRHFLHPDHAALYQPDGLTQLKKHLQPGGRFSLWSNDPPDQKFSDILAGAFDQTAAHVVSFDNPFQQTPSINTVYVAS